MITQLDKGKSKSKSKQKCVVFGIQAREQHARKILVIGNEKSIEFNFVSQLKEELCRPLRLNIMTVAMSGVGGEINMFIKR